MYRRSRFTLGSKALLVLGSAVVAMSAHAQYDLGSVTLNGTTLAPGIGTYDGSNTGSNTWVVNGYNTWAGGLNWTVGALSTPLRTLCSSFNEEFSIGTDFPTSEYWLSGATALNSSTVALGDNVDSSDTVAVPEASNPPGETSASFLQAANLFGAFYGEAMASGSVDAAALQLAIWQTLYTNPQLVPTFGDTHSQLAIDETSYYNLGASLASANNFQYLQNVDWYDFTAGGNGQGQFGYIPGGPSGTPEPFTIALSVAGLGFAIRRRMSRSA
jgi:hypothetical protein